MNSENPRPPSDRELDRLLGGKLRRTSPEFELRWREVRAGLGGARSAGRFHWARWWLWPGVATAALAAVLVVLVVRRPSAGGARPVTFEELIALDAALQPATPLLVAENRDALLNLPARQRKIENILRPRSVETRRSASLGYRLLRSRTQSDLLGHW